MKASKRILLRFTQMLTRNWREKLLALLLAFLFWFLVRQQAVSRRGYLYDGIPNLPARGQL